MTRKLLMLGGFNTTYINTNEGQYKMLKDESLPLIYRVFCGFQYALLPINIIFKNTNMVLGLIN